MNEKYGQKTCLPLDSQLKENKTFHFTRVPLSTMYSQLVMLLIITSFLGSVKGASSDTAVITVNFPGLSNVHTEVRITDEISGVATGEKIAQYDWRSNKAVIEVPLGQYDIKIQKGATNYVIDNVDCSTGDRTIDGLVAILTLKHPGLSSVNTSVQTSDGKKGTTSGEEVTFSTLRSNETEIKVLRQVYDLKIEKGAAVHVVDGVDCTSGICTVDGLSNTMTLNFPGVSSAHSQIFLADGIDESSSGKLIAQTNWKNDQAVVSVLPKIYDVKIKKGSVSYIVDNVDCTLGNCTINGLSSIMTINFPGLSGMFISAREADGVIGQANGNEIIQTSMKNAKTALGVFPMVYDLKIEKGAANYILDNVDCSTGDCTVEGISSLMTVNFPGMSSVHTTVHLADGIDGETSGDEFSHANWKEDKAVFAVLPMIYDLKIERGSAIHILDNVDCTSGACVVDNISSTMTVNFPGLTSVHTTVSIPDEIEGEASGKEATYSSWKNDQTVIKVFPQVYDLKVQKGPTTHIVDNVDCTSGTCTVTGLSSTMTVNFPGLTGVHTTLMVPDGKAGKVSGVKATYANWKNDQAVIKVLSQTYDLKIQKGAATTIVDNVDCSADTCTVDDLTGILTVEFPGQSGVHTTVLVPDNVKGTASGGEVTRLNWQKQKATIPLLRQIYDVKVEHDSTAVFDNVDCTSGLCNLTILGNAQVRLIDEDNDIPIQGHRIRAYERQEDDTLLSIQSRTTNENGAAYFSFEALGKNKLYVLRVDNPFGNEKRYYSSFISEEGPFEFRITRDGEFPLDFVPPEVNITSPVDGHGVSVNGFQITGSASDNNQIEAIMINIEDPSKGKSTIFAQYSEEFNTWSATVPPSMISASSAIALTATALDRAHNKTNVSITLNGIEDKMGPQITIISHSNNESVPETGFLLSGIVTDETVVGQVFATVEKSAGGILIDNRELEFSPNSGTWSLVVLNNILKVGNTIAIRLNAQDIDGNSSMETIQLQVVPVNNLGRHMINRITFGATPQLLEEVEEMGVSQFLSQQLNPDSIDDSEFEALIYGIEPMTEDELKTYSMLHMVYSKRQLQEVMTWFWENHFSTDIGKEGNRVSYELSENNQFRKNALGNFRDLLDLSAKSPAMLYYLDSVQNTAADSNENYAREILELHTMGVDGGYTSLDIEAGAEIFTGWQVRNDEFFFNANQHNFDPQLFLGEEIAGNGVEQGDELMDIVVADRATAEFISKKLVTLFVNDNPPVSLIQRAADVFQIALNDDDQMGQVIHEILTSPEFTASYRDKIKTPLELVVGFTRNLTINTFGTDLHSALEPMGMILHENSLPTGWSETGDDWINSNLLLERIKWVNQTANNLQSEGTTFFDPVYFFKNNGYETTDGIVGFLLKLAFGNDFTDIERSVAIEVLNDEEPFLLAAVDSEQKLRTLVGTVFSFPGYQYQ